jgi:hypothetical protein
MRSIFKMAKFLISQSAETKQYNGKHIADTVILSK